MWIRISRLLAAKNLCEDGLCEAHLGLDRSEMPQILDKPLSDVPKEKAEAAIQSGHPEKSKMSVRDTLLDALRASGVTLKEKTVRAKDLHSTQNEILSEKVERMSKDYQDDKLDFAELDPLIVSADLYLVDGHHRWATMMTLDPEMPCRILQVGIKIRPLLKMIHKHPGVYREDADGSIISDSAPSNKGNKTPKESSMRKIALLPRPDGIGWKEKTNPTRWVHADPRTTDKWIVQISPAGYLLGANLTGEVFQFKTPFESSEEAMQAAALTAVRLARNVRLSLSDIPGWRLVKSNSTFRFARFEEGESVDVPEYLREHGNPEAAEEWIEQNEKNRDNFKKANQIRTAGELTTLFAVRDPSDVSVLADVLMEFKIPAFVNYVIGTGSREFAKEHTRVYTDAASARKDAEDRLRKAGLPIR